MAENPRIVYPVPAGGTINQRVITLTNDSDYTLTVPAGHVWDLLAVQFELNATATVGNRVLGMVIYDLDDNVVYTSAGSGNIAANANGMLRCVQGAGGSTTIMPKRLTLPTSSVTVCTTDTLPCPFLIKGGYDIRLFDSAAVDAAADDGAIGLTYVDYSING